MYVYILPHTQYLCKPLDRNTVYLHTCSLRTRISSFRTCTQTVHKLSTMYALMHIQSCILHPDSLKQALMGLKLIICFTLKQICYLESSVGLLATCRTKLNKERNIFKEYGTRTIKINIKGHNPHQLFILANRSLSSFPLFPPPSLPPCRGDNLR